MDMKIKKLLQQGILTSIQNPYYWILGLLSFSGEIYLVMTNDQKMAFGGLASIFILMSIIAETGLLHSLNCKAKKQTSGLLDSIMSGISYIPQMIIIRTGIFLIVSFFVVILMILSVGIIHYGRVGQINTSNLTYSLFIIVLAPLLLFAQTLIFYAQAEVVIRDSNATDALMQSFGFLKDRFIKVIKVCVIFILIEISFLSIIFLFGGLSFEVLFETEVTPRMLAIRKEFDLAILNSDEFSLAKSASYIFWSSLQGRGIEISRLSLILISENLFRWAMISISLILFPLRISTLSFIFLGYKDLVLDKISESKFNQMGDFLANHKTRK